MLKSRLFYLLLSLILVWNAPSVRTESADVVFFYTTDTHGHIASDAETVGLDMIAGIKSQTPHALLLDAGDFLLGTPLATMSKGKDVVAFMKKAGYFAAAVGNHEFDYGMEDVLERKREAESEPDPMPLLSANVRYANGGLVFSPEARHRLNGVQICVFGLTTEESVSMISADLAGKLVFDDALAAARDISARQRGEGCEIIVALSHIGSQASGSVRSADIAALEDIDVVIDGHSHVVLEQKTQRGSMLVSPGAHGRFLGKLQISYDKEAGKIIRMRNTLLRPEDTVGYAPDRELTGDIFGLIKQQETLLGQIIGYSANPLDGSRKKNRREGTPLGALFADTAREAYGSDIAIINGGGLRQGVRAGKVSLRDIVSVLPFDNQVVSLKLTGSELLEVLEHGVSMLPELSGAFPQVSGMKIVVDASLAPGNRIVSVTLDDGSPLDEAKEYNLATYSYLALGGDDYPVLSGKRWLDSSVSAQEAAVRFFKKHGTSVYGPKDQSRIVFNKSSLHKPESKMNSSEAAVYP